MFTKQIKIYAFRVNVPDSLIFPKVTALIRANCFDEQAIEALGSKSGAPMAKVTISKSGELPV